MSESGAEIADRFFRLVGRAITDWANIEEELFHICGTVLNAKPQHVAIVYYRTPTLDGRISLVDELVRSLFPSRKTGEHATREELMWEKVMKILRDEKAIRRQLAHSPVSGFIATDPASTSLPNTPKSQIGRAQIIVTDIWLASYVSHTERLRGTKERQKEQLREDDIKTHSKKLSEAINHLRNFRENELATLTR